MSSDNKPLGFEYRGYKVTPSDRFYYNEYTYKINCKGNSVYRDIKAHANLDKILYKCWMNQSTYTSKNRVIYLNDIAVLDQILDNFPHLVEKVFGPIDQAHFEYISQPWKDTEYNFVYKDKLWYNKYDIKIDIKSRERYSWSSRYSLSQTSTDELEKCANEFMSFLNQQSFNFHLYLNTEAKYWHQNYLYCTSEDLKEIQPWISMLYSEVIEKISSAVIYTTDK
mgnify:CR=1 FL=1